jgi:hypothetical protein
MLDEPAPVFRRSDAATAVRVADYDDMTQTRTSTIFWGTLIVVVFLAHAMNYHHFFVDDEGITAVFAKHLLAGRGLSYAATEGPVEGYSNFLHVWVMAGLLALVDLARAERFWVFYAGAVYSMVCGGLLVWLTRRLCLRLGFAPFAAVTAALMLALAGPLAVWANSSLETVPFALALLGLFALTLPRVRHPWSTAVVAVVVILLRIDGFLFVGTWFAARLLTCEAADRRLLLRRVVPPVLIACAVFTAWRVWYFGAWLPLPLQAKVMHKLTGGDAAVVWTTETSYIEEVLRWSGVPILLAGLVGALGFGWHDGRRRAVWTLSLALAALGAYVGLVGDWMFGFRFVVALLAPLAVLVAAGLSRCAHRWPRVAGAIAVVLVAASAAGAWRFEEHFRSAQGKPLFWEAPSVSPAAKFGEYYDVLQTLKPLVRPGDEIAYHEAGFVPFMLDVENIDMLGLCTRFIGALPTRDAVHTDVGRYYPMAPRPAYNAVHAYLVYREPRLVVVRSRWMASANRGRVPETILGGHYTLATQTPEFALYGRSSQALNPRRTVSEGFLENLAHPAYLRRILADGVVVSPDDASEVLPSLWQGGGHTIALDPRWTLLLDPHDSDPVHEFYLEASAAASPVDVRVTLRGPGGGRERQFEARFPAGQPIRIWEMFDSGLPTDRAEVRITSTTGSPLSIRLHCLRLMGQTAGLRDHLEREGVGR